MSILLLLKDKWYIFIVPENLHRLHAISLILSPSEFFYRFVNILMGDFLPSTIIQYFTTGRKGHAILFINAHFLKHLSPVTNHVIVFYRHQLDTIHTFEVFNHLISKCVRFLFHFVLNCYYFMRNWTVGNGWIQFPYKNHDSIPLSFAHRRKISSLSVIYRNFLGKSLDKLHCLVPSVQTFSLQGTKSRLILIQFVLNW